MHKHSVYLHAICICGTLCTRFSCLQYFDGRTPKRKESTPFMKGPLGNLIVQILSFDQALNFKPKTLNPKLEVKTWRQGEGLK